MSHLGNKNICREVPITVAPPKSGDRHKNKVGKPITYYNLKRPFTVDGYDKKHKTVYLFQSCYWHGCRKCHPETIIKYDKRMEQVNLLEANGQKAVQMCE